jgi:site-specific DNA recombinase
VWNQVIKLLEDPELIRSELQRRIKSIRDSNPVKQKKDQLKKELVLCLINPVRNFGNIKYNY